MNKAEATGSQLRAMAEACGWLMRETGTGSWMATRGTLTVAIPPVRQWNERRLSTLIAKLQRYGEPDLVASWQQQQARLDERNQQRRATPLQSLTHSIDVPDRLRQEITHYADTEPDTEPDGQPETVDAGPERPVTSHMQGAVNDAAPTDADPEDADPEDADPEDAAPEDAAPEDAVPEGAADTDAVGADAGVDTDSAGRVPLNPATVLEFFRARPHRLVTVHELADRFGVDVKRAQRVVSGQVNRNLPFREAMVVHHPGWLWEWKEDIAGPAPPATPELPARQYATGVVHDDRVELRRLRGETADLRGETAELREQTAGLREQLAARERQVAQLAAEHQKLIDNVTAAQELLEGLLP